MFGITEDEIDEMEMIPEQMEPPLSETPMTKSLAPTPAVEPAEQTEGAGDTTKEEDAAGASDAKDEEEGSEKHEQEEPEKVPDRKHMYRTCRYMTTSVARLLYQFKLFIVATEMDNKLQMDLSNEENEALVTALRNTFLPRLFDRDASLFATLVHDLWPDVNVALRFDGLSEPPVCTTRLQWHI